ncbi:MAG: type transport system permease protein, partial [Gaiellales bacterium]|nr:type transport system permease protein [Gaiellales bacterium]
MSSVRGAAPATPPALQEIRGPSALAGDFKRFLVLTRTIALMDFKLRFFGSALGYLWQLM